MKCVKSIEIIEVDEDEIKIAKMTKGQEYVLVNNKTEIIDLEVAVELIQGEKFYINGDCFCIGWSEETYEALGIPIRCFKTMQNQLSYYIDKFYEMDQKIKGRDEVIASFFDMGFWDRLKFLFK